MTSLKKVLTLLLLLFIVQVGPCSAAPAGIDSLRQELKKINSPRARLLLCLKLGTELVEAGDKSSIYMAESAFSLADSMKLEPEKAMALSLQGRVWKIWGDNQKSVLCLFKALEIYRKLNRQSSYAEVLMYIGETNRAAGNLKTSMSFLKKALTIFTGQNDAAGLAKTYNRLAATSYEIYLNENPSGQDVYKSLSHTKFDFNQVYHSDSAFRQKYDQIFRYASLSNIYADKLHLASVKISTDIIMAALYTITYQFEKALDIYGQALPEIKKTNSNIDLPLVLYNIAILHFKKGEYNQAVIGAKECFRISKEADIKTYILISAGLISLGYENLGQYREAFEYSRIAYLGRIEYYQKDIDVKVKTMQYEFEIERKQKEINNRTMILRFLLVSYLLMLLMTSIFIAILIVKNKRKKLLNEELNNRNQVISQQNDQLAVVNAEKDKFFSIIAHDLRGPFNGFLGLTQVMAEDLPSMSPAEIQTIAQSLNNSASNLYSLLENLLTWSQLLRGLTPFTPAPVRLLPLVEKSLQPVLDAVMKKGIDITFNVPDYLEVFADENMIESTIRNLVSNAVKFTKKGGLITITAKAVSQKSVEFRIRDTGIGMNEQILKNLFKLDHNASRRGTENEPSSGLGLIICKEFVEKHGGQIHVESAEGQGSTFYFTI